MVSTPLQPSVPTHSPPAAYPPRALSRLALSQAHADVADLATAGVPTVCDRHANPRDFVNVANQLVAAAHEALNRAVVHARQLGGTWSEIADALAVTEDIARGRYTAVLDLWHHTLAQPEQYCGEVVVSRLPAGAREPDRSAHQLDQWCAEHLPPTSAARQTARREGITDRMVSAHLPTHLAPAELLATTSKASLDCADRNSAVEGGRR